MSKEFSKTTRAIFYIGAVIATIVSLHYIRCGYLYLTESPTQLMIIEKLPGAPDFALLDPNEAPEDLREAVLRGYDIMIDTPKNAPDYAGNELSCTNCHFCAGNTMGGKNGSISLAGVASAYPAYNQRAKTVVTLGERINGCFMRSMNGRPLPLNSDEMDALITYLHWIAKDFPIYADIPWRGLTPIVSDHTPNAENGKKIYAEKCALCHGDNGQGQIRIPPLWGDGSFNEGAGMNNMKTLSAFVHANMPYEDPGLTEEEALDVAAFIHGQPRPKFGH